MKKNKNMCYPVLLCIVLLSNTLYTMHLSKFRHQKPPTIDTNFTHKSLVLRACELLEEQNTQSSCNTKKPYDEFSRYNKSANSKETTHYKYRPAPLDKAPALPSAQPKVITIPQSTGALPKHHQSMFHHSRTV